MLSTTWRTIRALGFPALDSLGSRPFSLCRVSGSWYKNLDQDARTAHRKKTREHFLERLSANPEIRDADYRRFKLRYKEDEHYRCYRHVAKWCYRYPWLREQLPWKTHRPILYDRKVEHYCNACQWARTSGTKLWWVPLTNDNTMASGSREFLCHVCYSKNGWDQVMPAGHEDLRRIKDVAARSKQLGHTPKTANLTLQKAT